MMRESPDEICLRKLELMNQHLMLSKQLENTMRDGWLHLSKARYVMGYQASQAAQFDERERSTSVPVEITSSEKEPWKHYSIEAISDNSVASNDEVRKRFGFLSPNSAKQSGACFKKCLELAMELATVRAELSSRLSEKMTCD